MTKSKGLGKGQKRLLVNIITFILVVVLYFVLRLLIVNGVIDLYPLGILNNVLISVIMAVSLNMVTGLMGQLVLGHAGFMLIGAYTAALFTKNLGWSIETSLPISLVLAGLISAFFGVIIGVPALRLKGDYLAIITLGFGEIIRVVSNNLKITNGAKGMTGIVGYRNPVDMFTLIFIVAIASIFISYTYGTSRHGRAVISIREDEIAAESIGIRTTYYKLATFTLAAAFAGVAGGLYAHQIGVIDPAVFDFNKSVEYLVMVVLGGMGSITGAVISAAVLTALPEALRAFSTYRMLVYSIVLIIVMLFRPTGLLGRREFSLTKVIDLFIKDKNPNKRERKGA